MILKGHSYRHLVYQNVQFVFVSSRYFLLLETARLILKDLSAFVLSTGPRPVFCSKLWRKGDTGHWFAIIEDSNY
jgi:hypothetical protein